jgi:hypothetical protein
MQYTGTDSIARCVSRGPRAQMLAQMAQTVEPLKYVGYEVYHQTTSNNPACSLSHPGSGACITVFVQL